MDVVILAGGLGTRLRSVVSEVPKCMAPVSSRPFLFYLLKYLADYQFSKSFDSRVSEVAGNLNVGHGEQGVVTHLNVGADEPEVAGNLNVGLGEQRAEEHFKVSSDKCGVGGSSIERVVLSVGYLREKIYEWIDSCREQFPFQIVFAVEEQPLGTGGGIRLALEQCSSEHVAILNGDTFFGVDLDSFSDFHINSGALLSLALKPMEHFSRYGTVNVSENGMITAFNEKCYCERGLINGGLYLAKREALSQYLATKPEKFSFEKEVLEALVNSATTVNSATQVNPACGIDSDSFMSTVAVGGAECCADHKAALGAVFGFESNDYFIDIGIPEDYARAEREFKIASGIIDLGEGGDTLFLDRDGVINRLRVDDYVKCVKEFEFLPGVLSAIAEWSKMFKRIIVVTNQRGVGKGVMSEASLIEVHKYMVKRVEEMGGCIDAIYYCTALTDKDINRKPNPGMAHQALDDFPEILMAESVMIGDSESDRQFAKNSGIGRFICV